MKTEIKYVIVLVLICAISAALLAAVREITLEPIQAARKNVTTKAMQVILPEDVTPSAIPFPVDSKNEDMKGLTFYPVTTKDGKTVGAAVEVITDAGYGGEMKVMVGLIAADSPAANGNSGTGAPAAATICAVKIISHKETPGLGSKATDAGGFLEQFKDMTAPSMGIKLNKDPGGTIAGVTGATISSKAVTGAVDRAVKGFGIQFASMTAGESAR